MCCLAWSPRGGELLLGTLRGRVMRCSVAEQRVVSSEQTGHRRGVNLMLWAADDVVALASAKLVSRSRLSTLTVRWQSAAPKCW